MALFIKALSDADLINGIRIAGTEKRSFENKLYERFSYLIREGSWKHKLTQDECSMVYSDTVLTVIDHIQKESFKADSSIKTYLYQIFSNKCIDLLRKNASQKQQAWHGDPIDPYIHILPDESKSIIETLIARYDMDLLSKRLSELGDKCRQMIRAWGEGYIDQEIAIEMGYQSAAVVKTSRLRCLEKLRVLYGKGEAK